MQSKWGTAHGNHLTGRCSQNDLPLEDPVLEAESNEQRKQIQLPFQRPPGRLQ